jgi:UDP-glucuronate decarboxylase
MTSILGAVHTAELAKKCNAKLFHSSTSEVYGDPTVHPQPESYRGNVNPIGLRSCYDEGKRAAESLLFDYHRMYGVDIRVVRIFNTYGPHMHPFDGRVVSNFIRQALAGEEITIFGDGQQSRSFCYVDDLIDGFLKMMDADEATGPINLGNPGEFTMLELASLVLKLTGCKSELTLQPLPADDPTQRQPDITLAKSTLDWEPTIPLSEGLEKTIAWFSGIDLSAWTPPTPNWSGGLTER